MKVQVQLLKISKEGSPYSKSDEKTNVLVLPRGKKLNIGDPVVGIYGLSEVVSISEKDPFDAYIYFLKEGSSLVNPRKVVAFEDEIDPEFIQKEKDLEGPFYIEIENNLVLKKSGRVKIFR